MLRGYYIAANGLINQQRTIDTLANNIANVKTAGYKSDLSVKNTFKEELLLLNQGRKNTEGTIQYQYTQESRTILEQGSFEFTKSPLDIALQGPVYFNIQRPDGQIVLSRNGQFSVDDEGYLSLAGSGRVMTDGGPLKVDGSDFSISEGGQIFVEGNFAGNLALSYIDENTNVQKNGDSTFTVAGGADTAIPEGTQYAVVQGAYERSNVDMGEEMSRVIAAQRSFENMAQALTMIDKINTEAASRIGKF